MALNFNPFEKGKGALTPNTKTKHSHYRVFDDPTKSTETEQQDVAEAALLPNAAPLPTIPAEDAITQVVVNGLQTDDKEATNGFQNGLQTDHKETTDFLKRTTQRTTKRITTRLQTDYKRTTNSDFSTLVGHERHLLLFIFNECRSTGELITAPLTLSRIKEELHTPTSSTAKTIISRLIAKDFIRRATAKTGRGGWMSFQIEKEMFQRLLLETDYKRTTNRVQTDDKQATKQATQRTTTPSSSSSSLRSISIEELLTTEKPSPSETELDASWQAIDSSPLTEFRFGRNQILQIVQSGRVTPEQLQESIHAFAFDLTENQKAKSISGAPLNYFMGILRKGPYAPPANYENPEDRQQRLYLEAKEQQGTRRQEIQKRLETAEFEEWAETLSLEQRAELIPPKEYAKPGSTAHNIQLREYFRENVWPQLREKNAEGTLR